MEEENVSIRLGIRLGERENFETLREAGGDGGGLLNIQRCLLIGWRGSH